MAPAQREAVCSPAQMANPGDLIRSDWIGGRFLEPVGAPLVSRNPARDGKPVLETLWSVERVAEAVAAAKEAHPSWFRLSFDERLAILHRFRAAIVRHKEDLADAIVREVGKIRSEARAEVDSLIARFDLVESHIRQDLREGPLPGFPNEELRWHPHGVVAVIGPFNFPLHLCHAHVVPALLLGNTVVVKPSEITPLCGVRYAEAAAEAGLPPGALNVVQGKGPTGAALVAHPDVRALAFTGSWAVGRRIAEAALDKPEMLIALEMGGKNTVVVCEDADVRQAAHEIVVGAYLTTGQRCTCTDRVLVHRKLAGPLIDALRKIVPALVFGDPDDPRAFAGPMATAEGREKLERAMAAAEKAGAEVVVEGRRLPGGYYRTASVHRLPEGVHDIPGYTDVELFGPDLGIEIVDDDDEAIAVVNASPYGFANSIFTSDDARFERYYRETRCGVLNRNRSTNQASPRLPFGGTGRSGNFRPAGSFAPRNLAIPVAVQRNAALSMTTHPLLGPLLPGHDLDRLAAMHAAEERAEAARAAYPVSRPMRVVLPRGGVLPESTRWLERLHAGGRIARGTVPLPVVDTLRSRGPWIASIDEQPLVLLDGTSRGGRAPLGFAPDALVRGYVEGRFGDGIVRARDGNGADAALFASVREALANTLRTQVPGLPCVSFVATGAEANEKAIALFAAARGTGRVLTFEGCSHGRTLFLSALGPDATASLGRGGGEEPSLAPWPAWERPVDPEPPEPVGWRAACAAADRAALAALASESTDPLLRAEIASLTRVIELLSAAPHAAVVVEPMATGNGDRYATARWHRGLRLITRALGVPLILDEVQCGFGASGRFAWHQHFGYVDANGEPDRPDAVTFGEAAQLGIVLASLEDPDPAPIPAVALVRSALVAGAVGDGEDARRIEAWVRARAPELTRRWEHLATGVRARGFFLAFDLPSREALEAYLGQARWRGARVGSSGERTVRYRLNAAFTEEDVELLFRTIHQSLAWLEAHPGRQPPAWEDLGQPARRRPGDLREIRIRRAEQSDVEQLLPQILALEAKVYEPARRDPPERLRLGFEDPDGIALLAERAREDGSWELVGYAIGAPLERITDVPGPDRDPARGRHDTMYSIALSVDPALQGSGLGRHLKREQLAIAAALRKSDGTPRYRWVTGRNRLDRAGAMVRLNDSFGAYTVEIFEKQYGEKAKARYYRQPLGPLAVEGGMAGPDETSIDLGSGLIAPLADPPAALLEAERDGRLAGPVIEGLVLSEGATPAAVRAIEWIAAIAPDLPQLLFTSGRDEAVDEAIRLLGAHRPRGRVAISFAGTYVGHTTACARSVSDPRTHGGGGPCLPWPRIPHPDDVGDEAAEAELRRAIADAGGPEAVLGIVLEPVQERTGRVIGERFAARLAALRREIGVPLVFVETASAYYRSGRGAFASDPWEHPDLRIWWSGGQLGIVQAASAFAPPHGYAVIGGGDELSLIQAHHQLRVARTLDVEGASRALDEALRWALDAGFVVRGLGLYRVLEGGERCELLDRVLRARKVIARPLPGGRLAIAPALDRAGAQIEALARALAEALRS